ncbi:hypothetical protein GNP10_14090, partial [Escherichia coli]|nr:hypothetical protein [Escherichia coli]
RAFQMMTSLGSLKVLEVMSEAVNVIAEGEVLIRPTKSYKFNVLQFIGRPDKRSASGNLTLVISLMPITLLMWWWVN